MHSCISGSKLASLICLCMNPTQWLHISQVRVIREIVWYTTVLISSNLRYHDDAFNFFDLIVVGRGHTVEVAAYLNSQIADTNETFQNVLRHHVSNTRLLDVIRIHIYLIRS